MGTFLLSVILRNLRKNGRLIVHLLLPSHFISFSLVSFVDLDFSFSDLLGLLYVRRGITFAYFFHFVILILTDRRLWRFFVFGHSQNFFDRKILCAKIFDCPSIIFFVNRLRPVDILIHVDCLDFSFFDKNGDPSSDMNNPGKPA